MSLQGVLRRTPAGASGIRTASHGLILSAPGTPLGKPSIHESNAVESRYSSGACPWPNAQRNSSAPSGRRTTNDPAARQPRECGFERLLAAELPLSLDQAVRKKTVPDVGQEDLWVVPFLLRESHRGDITLNWEGISASFRDPGRLRSGFAIQKRVSLWTNLAQRWLGPREEQRVGAAVLSFIVSDIQERMARGEQPRTDRFFVEEEGHRSDAEEVAENVILKCQREPEEMKIRYLGYLFSNVVFDSEISAQMAHQLTKHAEQLTYRQYGVLKVAQFEALRVGLRAQDYSGEPSHPLGVAGALVRDLRPQQSRIRLFR